MWWARSKLTEAYLGTNIVGVRGKESAAWVDVADLESASNQLLEMLRRSAPKKGRVRVWLSAALSRAFVVPADCGARDDKEAQAIAQALAGEVTGMASDLSIWTDLWHPQRGCLAVAMPMGVLVTLREGCADSGLRLRSVKPWWNLALEQALSQSRTSSAQVLWSLAEPDAMTLGTLAAGAVKGIDTLDPAAHDPNWTHAQARARAGQGGDVIQWSAEADFRGEALPELPIGALRLNASVPKGAPESRTKGLPLRSAHDRH